jgi:uncharacterized protein YbgA (DUF1722 family)/uncharacterized protein YbbK (DUF523 family)
MAVKSFVKKKTADRIVASRPGSNSNDADHRATIHSARPRIVVSKCLGFEECRYDGSIIEDDFLKNLEPYVDFITVCPEAEIGLGTPRPPIRIVSVARELKLIQPATKRDVSEEMNLFTSRFLNGLSDVDAFVLKSRSPSCGFTDVKVYASLEKGPSLGRTRGFFGGAIQDRFPDLAVEDEGRLKNFHLREHFLIRLFALARLRELMKAATSSALVEFQAQNKFLLMAYNQKEMRELGRLVANLQARPFSDVAADYEKHFRLAFARAPRGASHVNVLQHALGFFSDELTAREKQHFLQLLSRYAAGKIPLASALSVMKSWITRFQPIYLSSQTYFHPFPEDLIELMDSGKGRV